MKSNYNMYFVDTNTLSILILIFINSLIIFQIIIYVKINTKYKLKLNELLFSIGFKFNNLYKITKNVVYISRA